MSTELSKKFAESMEKILIEALDAEKLVETEQRPQITSFAGQSIISPAAFCCGCICVDKCFNNSPGKAFEAVINPGI